MEEFEKGLHEAVRVALLNGMDKFAILKAIKDKEIELLEHIMKGE